MRRVLDVLVVAAILGAVGWGAYQVGKSVDNTSNTLAKHDSELNQTVVRRPKAHGPSHHTLEMIVIAVTGAAGVMLLVSVGGALMRGHKRQRWHAT